MNNSTLESDGLLPFWCQKEERIREECGSGAKKTSPINREGSEIQISLFLPKELLWYFSAATVWFILFKAFQSQGMRNSWWYLWRFGINCLRWVPVSTWGSGVRPAKSVRLLYIKIRITNRTSTESTSSCLVDTYVGTSVVCVLRAERHYRIPKNQCRQKQCTTNTYVVGVCLYYVRAVDRHSILLLIQQF